MSDEQTSNRGGSLDERFADDPVLRERLHQIADMRERLLAEGASLDEVEEQTVQQIRMLGRELLQSIGQSKAEQSATQVREEHPAAIKHRKKIVWQTTYGPVELVEAVLRLGRRGRLLRYLWVGRYSKKLQRALTDFGAEDSFLRAAVRL